MKEILEKIKFDLVTYRLLYSLKGELEVEKRKREASYTVEEILDSSQFTSLNISLRRIINKPSVVKRGREYALASKRKNPITETEVAEKEREKEVECFEWEPNKYFSDQITEQNEVILHSVGGAGGDGNFKKSNARRTNLNSNYQLFTEVAENFECKHSRSRTM